MDGLAAYGQIAQGTVPDPPPPGSTAVITETADVLERLAAELVLLIEIVVVERTQ